MIFIGLGANLKHPTYGPPAETLKAAIRALNSIFSIKTQSSLYQSAPVPMSDQPWFFNAVISISTSFTLEETLKSLHKIEKEFGRVREKKWEARILDLDLLVFHKQVTRNREQLKGPVVPHPFLAERMFVLEPIQEIAPNWRHPVLNLNAAEMLSILPKGQRVEKLPPG
ncbi:2-amino-4-hydroxy-6-hydroxymethyldihydropteridine diphosphokinase [Sneathiella marina]|uniref:2-amino-4-hydroxy-6-hydroxymethyldihydropteridine pyrophosphokinase n=1 Tax=Sneathiella marina TaxID=2950108 RepID=A0ABY4VY12_9PROT|nr:2-amino-4-hydroxy-6-hydroxymethyldihydropteridine diphosphokinase [Sneathiella marina]USG59817.1 2-amino-4-hydroxy-6-hydroxymethyldihydropteridine diphosphokinase [Sneathiella marina]